MFFHPPPQQSNSALYRGRDCSVPLIPLFKQPLLIYLSSLHSPQFTALFQWDRAWQVIKCLLENKWAPNFFLY